MERSLPELFPRHPLAAKSLEIILGLQTPWGSFPAAPDYRAYAYCWLRDGSFVAYALDRYGYHQEAGAFYRWVLSTLSRYRSKLQGLLEISPDMAAHLGGNEFLHTRYTLDGYEAVEPWGNFQLDGYGMYLWALGQHSRMSGGDGVLDESIPIALRVGQYLVRYWKTNCLDCWEENDTSLHPSTLAAIYGGLDALSKIVEVENASSTLKEIKELLLTDYIRDGHLVKNSGSSGVDANLLWVAVPFGLLDLEDPFVLETVREIQSQLLGGGLHRHRQDSYYGGGEWVLLTAWLGWYFARMGDRARAVKALEWVEAQAGASGLLPEQVPVNLYYPTEHDRWLQQEGPVARPLLWSHAMYLILLEEIHGKGGGCVQYS